jgi:serpin B
MAMQRLVALVPMTVAVGLFAAGCRTTAEPAGEGAARSRLPSAPVAQTGTAGQHDQQTAAQRDTDPRATEMDIASICSGNAQFGLRLARKLAEGSTGNLCVSPYSLEQAFGMVSAGAKGATLEGIRKTVVFALPEDQLHAALNRLDLDLQPKDGGFTLRSANGVWLARDCQLVPAFGAEVERNYGVGVGQAVFPDPGREEINRWVSDQTAGRIPEVLPEGAVRQDTRLVLANALYFLAKWAHPFKKEGTRDETFRTPEGDVTVPMMCELASFPYAEGTIGGKRCQALHLPYAKSTIEMVVLLPEEGALPLDGTAWEADALGLSGAVASLRAAGWEGELSGANDGVEAKPREVDVMLPKWDLGSLESLADPLQGLGMATAFSDKADFSGMVEGEPVMIGDVFHATRVTVDEAGTEAAAATAVIMAPTAAPVREEPVAFHADHPFLYLIRDSKTGQVLFLGRVSDPTQ